MREHLRLELFQRTRQMRLQRNLTFAALAADVGCSLATARRFANGLGRPNERTLFLFQMWLVATAAPRISHIKRQRRRR